MRLGEHYGQRYARETSAAPHVEHLGLFVEAADARYGQRVEHVFEVERVDVLARDDVDACVPFGVGIFQQAEPLALRVVEAGKYFSINSMVFSFFVFDNQAAHGLLGATYLGLYGIHTAAEALGDLLV